jgi:hypothetical protein
MDKNDYKNILEKVGLPDSLVKKVGKVISEGNDALAKYMRTEYWTEERKQEKYEDMQGNQNRKGTTTSSVGRSNISMRLLGNANGHGNKPAGIHEHQIIPRSLQGHLRRKDNSINLSPEDNLIDLTPEDHSLVHVALSAFFDHAPLCKASTRSMSSGLGMTWTKDD